MHTKIVGLRFYNIQIKKKVNSLSFLHSDLSFIEVVGNLEFECYFSISLEVLKNGSKYFSAKSVTNSFCVKKYSFS